MGSAADVTITGSGFVPKVTISYGSGASSLDTTFTAWLGATELGAVTYADASTLRAVVPGSLAAGVYDLRVVDPAGVEARLNGVFTVYPSTCTGDECPEACELAGEVCGDRLVCGAEVCDDGQNGDPCDGCLDDCTAHSNTCGDGYRCGAEVCDDGSNDASLGSCATDCSADPPAALSFGVQPTDSLPSTSLVPAVEVVIEDSAGRRVRGASAAVSLGLGSDPSGGAALLSGAGPLAAVDGVASFAAVQLDTPAVGYTLSASCASLGSATSASFDIAEQWPGTVSGWQYRKRIDIPSRLPAAALTDFPLLIDLVDADLRDRALVTGFDVLFTDEDGAVLEHEIERYDGVNGGLVAWVRLPSFDTSADTALYLYYGNASATADPSVATVWSSAFFGVWHLDEAGAGDADEYADASGAGNGGTGGGGSAAGAPSQTLAKIGMGQDLDGQDDLIVTKPSIISGLAELTLSMWVFVRSDDNTARPALAGQNNALEMGFYWNDRINVWCPGMTTLCPGKGIESACTADYGLDEWSFVTVTLDGVELAIYVNGVEKHRVPQASTGSTAFTFNIGGEIYDDTGNNLDAMIDEVRVAAAARSAEWIAIEHASQVDAASFYSVGLEEAR